MKSKKFFLSFYEEAFSRKDSEKASKCLGQHYVQHNQTATDGATGLKNFIAFLREKYPNMHSDIKQVFEDRNYMILHVRAVKGTCDTGHCRWRHFQTQGWKSHRVLGCA
jgi:predicted SnoaL-like aldol condensation-catalyzing enzyme